METKLEKAEYEKRLRFAYGDNKKLIENMNKALNIYSNCKHQDNKKLIARVESYKKTKKLAKIGLFEFNLRIKKWKKNYETQ